jgi:hypothetical protein
VLWNQDEAYLFMSVARRGLHVSYLGYAGVIFREYLNGVREPDDERKSVVVIEITSSAVEQHVLEVADSTPGMDPGSYTPIEGRIYANYPGIGGLCRWDGDRFEPATGEEQRRLDGINRLTSRDFDNVNGWSKRTFVPAPSDYQFEVRLGEHGTLRIRNRRLDRAGNGGVSIDLQRPGQAPHRIWYLDGRPRTVSRIEYEQLFGRR